MERPAKTLVKSHLDTAEARQLEHLARVHDRSLAAELRVAIRFYLKANTEVVEAVA
jgi:hypothetical protein